MNSRQKQTTKYNLDAEQEVIRKLKGIYKKALDDIDEKIAALEGRTDVENLRSIIYQKDYQNALKKQISAILDGLNGEQFTTISDYLTKCYENGFLSTMYDIHGQGIPIITPIDQKQVVRAVQHDTKLSKSLYNTLGEDVSLLKKRIANNISRGIAQGSSYADIARNIASGMVGDYSRMKGGKLSKAMTIARTEGHRIQSEAAFDAQVKAKEKGADIVKQWDATLDKRTRESHAALDGQIQEIDKPFHSPISGKEALYPGDFGVPEEDINCRCAVLQRAKWALDEDELKTLEERAEYFGLDKSENFEDFKTKYLDASKNVSYNNNVNFGGISGARNPYGQAASKHAEKYYNLVRSMKTDVEKISMSTSFTKEEIQSVKDYIFYEKHDLGDNVFERFIPDYFMAQSWQRLINGTPEPHDVTLIHHELLEKELMDKGLSQNEAHIKASAKYNYSKEADEYYDQITKYKKE